MAARRSAKRDVLRGTGFIQRPSGIYIPLDAETGSRVQKTTTFMQLRDDGRKLLGRFRSLDITTPPGNAITSMVDSVCGLSDNWLGGKYASISHDVLIDACSLHRICQAALSLEGHIREGEFLGKLLDGGLSIVKRERRSVAKDTLYEVELWRRLKEGGIDARLEEPDLAYQEVGGATGIAVKKLYSDRHVQN